MNAKRITATCLAALLLTCCLATAASAVTMGVVHTFVSKYSNVNLRTGPGSGYASSGYVNNGDLVQILSDRTAWDRVLVKSGVSKGRTGYIFDRYITNLRDIEDISGWGALAHIKTAEYGSNVSLRSGPGTSYAVKERLATNDWLIVLDRYNRYWYEVQVINSWRTGFVYAKYIANGVVGHTTANVHLRSRASSSASILDVIPNGEPVTVYNIGKNWSKVRYDGETGYVYNGYLKLF